MGKGMERQDGDDLGGEWGDFPSFVPHGEAGKNQPPEANPAPVTPSAFSHAFKCRCRAVR